MSEVARFFVVFVLAYVTKVAAYHWLATSSEQVSRMADLGMWFVVFFGWYGIVRLVERYLIKPALRSGDA